MEDIKVGDYVINQNRLVIGQITAIDKEKQEAMIKTNNVEIPIGFWNIRKHSKDITDLIEVGDVIEVHFPVRNTIRKIYADEYFEDSMILNGIINGNVILKTILTHEQFEANCYKTDTK